MHVAGALHTEDIPIMTSHARYRIKTPPVIQETIDGEAVIVNLDSGNYYSLEGVGAEIWTLLEARASLEEIVKEMAAEYQVEPDTMWATVRDLVNELEHEDLVAPDDGSESPVAGLRKADSGDRADAGGHKFEMPILHKYTDMQDLLLLDPIHEVGETGWPNPLPGNPDAQP
jgi:hypothetical protein